MPTDGEQGVLIRTMPYLAVFAVAVMSAEATTPGFTAVAGCAVYVGNAILKTTLGGEPLYVP